MKKFILLMVFCFTCSAVLGATYKVNTSGKVTTPTGSIQQKATVSAPAVITPQNIYTNYYSSQYVQNKQALTGSISTINIVMDYSGSMSYWIEAAKLSMAAIVSQLPASTKVGFRVFGNDSGSNPYTPALNKVKSIVKNENGKYKVKTVSHSYLGTTSGVCSATSQMVPVSPYNAATLLNGMNSARIGGATPMTLALQQAVYNDFAGMDTYSPKKIILITDGGENCGGDPCSFAKQLVAARKDIMIDVVLVSSTSQGLRCLADTTGGKFYNTNDISNFANVLMDSMQNASSVVTPVQQPVQNYEFIEN